MLFELEWMGGTAARLFQQHRGDRIDELPWDAFQAGHLSDAERDRLRTVWTQSAHQEWCAGGAFASLQTALLRARAPVDLIGMAGRFVADEMVHVELASRMANAYGGGVPLDVDPLAIQPTVDEGLEPLLEACSLAIRISCVGESFSLPVLASELASAADPLSKAVLTRITADEAPHALVGGLVLEWARAALTATDREFLSHVAQDAVDALTPAVLSDPAHHTFYLRILRERVAGPLAAEGIQVRSTFSRCAG